MFFLVGYGAKLLMRKTAPPPVPHSADPHAQKLLASPPDAPSHRSAAPSSSTRSLVGCGRWPELAAKNAPALVAAWKANTRGAQLGLAQLDLNLTALIADAKALGPGDAFSAIPTGRWDNSRMVGAPIAADFSSHEATVNPLEIRFDRDLHGTSSATGNFGEAPPPFSCPPPIPRRKN
jgi:hypothetical protein